MTDETQDVVEKFPSIVRQAPANQIANALVQCCGDLVEPVKHGVGNFRNTYVTLPTILELLRPVLFKHDLTVQQYPSSDGKSLVTAVMHKSGEAFTCTYPLALPATVSKGGRPNWDLQSTISYARRYALMMVFQLAGDEEDEPAGQVGSGEHHPPTTTPALGDAGRIADTSVPF